MFNSKPTKKCDNCKIKVDKGFSYCPNCGYGISDKEKEFRDFGILGKGDLDESDSLNEQPQGFGITDKIINSMVNSLMKSLNKQFRDMDKEFAKQMENDMNKAEIQTFPNGIKIRIGYPQEGKQKKPSILKKEPSSDQIKKLSSLPKASAKSSIKRLSDTILYELATPGVESVRDIFVSKLEEGYEIKAIGSKKVYTNSLPINLPLKRLSLLKDKLLVEFKTDE